MKFNKLHLFALFCIISFCVWLSMHHLLQTSSVEYDVKDQIKDLNNVLSGDIELIAFLSIIKGKISCYKISDRNSIKKFSTVVRNYPTIPLNQVTRFHRDNIVTIYTKKEKYSIHIYDKTWGYHKDIAEIRFFENSNFDILEVYGQYKGKMNEFGLYVEMKYKTIYSSSLRNIEILTLLKESIDENKPCSEDCCVNLRR